MIDNLVRLGRTATGKDVYLDPYAPAHTVLTGATRSGKSVQLYGILAQLIGHPVQLCGVDPTGVLFNPVGSHLGGDDLRVLTTRDTSRVLTVMSDLLDEMDKRIVSLLSQRLDKFTAFSSSFPLLLVVFEEYPGLLATLKAIDQASGAKVADRVETKVRAAVQRLALEGAKVGVRLMLVSQRADAEFLTGVLRSQLTQRCSFKQDADGLHMMHQGIAKEDVERAQNFIPGQAFIEVAGEPLTQYRADLITYSDYRKRFA